MIRIGEGKDYKFPRGGKNVLTKIHKGNWKLGSYIFPVY